MSPDDSRTVPIEALRRAVAIYGSQSAAARRRGVTQGAFSKWLAGKAPLPAEQVLPIEADTGISRHELRPDIYPHEAPAPDTLEPAR